MHKLGIFAVSISAAMLYALPRLQPFALAQKPDNSGSRKLSATTLPTASVDDPRLITIPVLVYDKKGELVQRLSKDDFALEVDKKPREIRTFEVAGEFPVMAGLLVDTSVSQRDLIAEEQTASSAFLDDLLAGAPGHSKAFVVQFARQVDLLQDTTSSKPLLQAGLRQLGTGDPGQDPSKQASVTVPDPKRDSSDHTRRGGNETLYDAIYLSADGLLGKQKGRKVVIILSDGVDSGSKESLSSAIEISRMGLGCLHAAR